MMRPRFDTVLLRFKPVAPRQRQDLLRMCTIKWFRVTGELGCQWYPDSPGRLKNGHDSTHGATKNNPDSALVELRLRPRPQSTTIHPKCFKRFMLASHCPEDDTRWKHDDRNFHIRLWSWKHRAIREGILSHRMVAGGLSQAPAAASWAWQNLWHVKKFQEGLAKMRFRIEFVSPSCPSWGHREGILSYRVVFVFSSCDHRWHRAFFASRILYEGNKNVSDCLGRQHDFLKPSHCRRVAINSKKFTKRWHQDGIRVSTKTVEFE